MELKCKSLHKDAVLPKRAYEHDAGLDLVAVDNGTLVGPYLEYDTGVAVQIPVGYVGLLFPRSSITNTDLMLKNSVGVIDSGYTNSVKFRFHEAPQLEGLATRYAYVQKGNIRKYKKGDKIGQLVVVPLVQLEPTWTNELSSSARGIFGFGSSDSKK